MSARKKMTRLIQIGLSHGEKAKRLSEKGYYAEALEELDIALSAFCEQNKDGSWDNAIAGILNNIGFVSILLNKYEDAANAFLESLKIKSNLDNNDNILGTLTGLSEAYRCLCEHEAAIECIEDAFELAIALKENDIAFKLLQQYDKIERSKNRFPDMNYLAADYDEIYLPELSADISAVIRNINLKVLSPDTLKIDMVIGFPGLKNDLADIRKKWQMDSVTKYGSLYRIFPCLFLLFPQAVAEEVTDLSVVNEEETPVSSSSAYFNGNIYEPGSYHRSGPQAMPEFNSYTYCGGKGALIEWDIEANGWYHLSVEIKLEKNDKNIDLTIVLPFGSSHISKISMDPGKHETYRSLRIDAGKFYDTDINSLLNFRPENVIYSDERKLYEGSLNDIFEINADISQKYCVLSFRILC
ncbi:hypothetical protein CUJ83_12490 [Methanocella sp. CWC-04]|uniref:Tetratricopeptide repeat-containing protein n=1 Tax=Methanooceanicella nereidis TaxID=2052831 RepID=A0AAP2W5R1_9EURY|nr:tetratricopeptide repeat protein [Methanocella sp. CWC-04]MCD1295815.1 hypothetical protein [Methanocella sp. CWC-04]